MTWLIQVIQAGQEELFNGSFVLMMGQDTKPEWCPLGRYRYYTD